VKYGEGIFTRLLNVSPRNNFVEPLLEVPLMYVTAPAVFLDMISSVMMSGSKNAVATTA
jgi:hypothetical protein